MLYFTVIIIVIALLCYPFFEATLISVDERTLNFPKLEKDLKNMRIVYVSDIHQGFFFDDKRTENLISQINSLDADIVILGGDYATNPEDAVSFFYNTPAIRATLGVFAVLGDMDRKHFESDLSSIKTAIKQYGATPLVNDVAYVKRGSSYVYIAGVDDITNGFADIQSVANRVTSDDFVIFVGHSPELIPEILTIKDQNGHNHWYDLALFGHTHGGQVKIGNWTPLYHSNILETSNYISGLKEINRTYTLISNGVGTSTLPIRLGAIPQIHLLVAK